jgi:hypothetical protein
MIQWMLGHFLLTWIVGSWAFDFIRDDPRFKELVGEEGGPGNG